MRAGSLHHYRGSVEASDIFRKIGEGYGIVLAPGKYFVVSAHREENVDHPAHLQKILAVLNRLADGYGYPVIVSTHPRTRKRLEALDGYVPDPKILFLKPFGFFDFVHLEMHAACTLSDSGTISEESSILSFPAVSIRQSMERPEAQDAGTIILTGLEPQNILDAVALVLREHGQRRYTRIAEDYTIADTSWRVLKLITGNAGLSNQWHGVSSGR